MTTIGFTGTRRGLSARQRASLSLLALMRPYELHHGDCIGADRDAHEILAEHCDIIVLHPSTLPQQRAHCERIIALPSHHRPLLHIEPPSAPLTRNRAIVRASSLLIAAPHTLVEQQRSGTWATVRYARSQRVPVILLDP